MYNNIDESDFYVLPVSVYDLLFELTITFVESRKYIFIISRSLAAFKYEGSISKNSSD